MYHPNKKEHLKHQDGITIHGFKTNRIKFHNTWYIV